MNKKHEIIKAVVDALDIPPSYYEKAHSRYEDLGKWLGRPGSLTQCCSPRIYGQGSFRLGTVIRPLNDEESYDLDIGCRLESGIRKTEHSQEQLKTLVGVELEQYRRARNIESPLDEKHRCWRVEYADEMAFHMDIVPSIPEQSGQRSALAMSMESYGLASALARSVADLSGNITDNRLWNYKIVDSNWRISNSEGYAMWFESRLAVSAQMMQNMAGMAKEATVEKLPLWRRKSPLQQAIQVLKRHRDSMFARAPDAKPISIILTTLAARAYQGENDVTSALEGILSRMDRFVNERLPRVPNPVNPSEDFADKWYDPKYQSLNLEGNFREWLKRARADLSAIDDLLNRDAAERFISTRFSLRIPVSTMDQIAPLLGRSSGMQTITEKPASMLRPAVSATAANSSASGVPTFPNARREPTSPRGFA